MTRQEWGMRKDGRPYLKKNSKKPIVATTVDDGYKVLTVSMFRKDNKNKMEVLGTTRRFDNPEDAREFGKRVSKLNAEQSGHPKDTKVNIIVVKNRVDALKKIEALKAQTIAHEPNHIDLYTTDGILHEFA